MVGKKTADRSSRAEIPPPEGLVIGRRGKDVIVGVPDDGFDRCGVDAGAEFEAFDRAGVAVDGAGRLRGGGSATAGLSEVEDAKFLLVTTRCDDLWGELLRECDCFDNMIVRKSMETLSAVGIPNFASKRQYVC